MTTDASREVRGLSDLIPRLAGVAGFPEVVDAVRRGQSAAVEGAWGSSRALTIAALSRMLDAPLVVVMPRMPEAHDLAVDLESCLGAEPELFPAWETLPREHSMSDPVFGARLRTLMALRGGRAPRLIVTSITALMQPVPERSETARAVRRLAVGDELDLDDFTRWLIEKNFERVHQIERPGEFRLQGGILDVFPPDALDPIRVELFGDEIESIRTFDVETQRSLETLDAVALTVVAPVSFGESPAAPASSIDRTAGESFLDSLSPETVLILNEPAELQTEGRGYLERLDEKQGMYRVETVLAAAMRFSRVNVGAITAAIGDETALCRLRVESVERLTGPKHQVLHELAGLIGDDETVLIACHNAGERERLTELLAAESNVHGAIRLILGHVERGYRLVEEKLLVIGDHELFGRTELHVPQRRRRLQGRAIDSFLDLRAGDLVVHLAHGIGRFRGMKLLEHEGRKEEHLAVEFRDKVVLYVPASLIHLIQKYVGAKKSIPQLSKVGGTTWARKKERAAESVADMASDMLKLQALRSQRPGIAFPPDSTWQREFESAFPYTETEDQLQAVADLKRDMQLPRPMDRLICGDVGFGKTEVAIRAAFKAIEAGRQAAILVPTTVLAEQHYRTFSERMAEYPFTIEVLSRFRTAAEQKEILQRMESGAVDLVVGTHRLVQRDVRFRDLGLLIIDEEQRFGVEAKEMLKQLRLEVDVLTLSATPIPRTLHMSLLGIRDISNLVTPPRERVAVKTQIGHWDDHLIRSAIIRELNRGGQVYFVHNRVYNIETICDRLKCLVPEARFTIGHGQMPETQLEQAMYDFLAHRADVLVSTTIIESGLDIPNANTIFIHQAERYGLADLHQLRGRVGRYRHRAYCYLLLEEGKSISPIASKRLKSIEEFSELGAGFKIAMRDLEIRGAGNILGTEQSGHISAVGYELYCQLLENAVRTMKGEPLRDVPQVSIDLRQTAFIPDDYIASGRLKIEAYRRFSLVGTVGDLDDLRQEFRDRYGPLPVEVEKLARLKQLQLYAHNWKIDDIHLEDRFAVFGYRDAKRMAQLRHLVGSDLRIVDDRRAYLLLKVDADDENALFSRLNSVLQSS